jgi:hypothetical protein
LVLRSLEAGNRASFSTGLIGRRTSSPLQFGQRPPKFRSAHSLQNVHSNVQIMASSEEGGRSRSQHSQLGLISNMPCSPVLGRHCANPQPSVQRELTGRFVTEADPAGFLNLRALCREPFKATTVHVMFMFRV